MSWSWLLLVAAGSIEVVWALGLKSTQGFTRFGPSVGVVSAMAVSLYLLSAASRSLPIGTAYAVWVGIGALGTAVLGVVVFREPLTMTRAGFVVLLVVAIIGLKMTGPTR